MLLNMNVCDIMSDGAPNPEHHKARTHQFFSFEPEIKLRSNSAVVCIRQQGLHGAEDNCCQRLPAFGERNQKKNQTLTTPLISKTPENNPPTNPAATSTSHGGFVKLGGGLTFSV